MIRIVLLASLLSGCAASPYWRESPIPLPYQHIVYVDFPCGHKDYDGCANFISQTIEIKRGLSKEKSACVLTHEKRHFLGWTHGIREGIFLTDCGDGTKV